MESRRVGRLLITVVLALLAGSLYLTRLREAPRYVARDEIVYSLNAQSIASNGRDLNGRFLPMYIEYPKGFGRPTWDQPLLIYAIASTLTVVPFSEFAVRLPMAIAGVVDVLLMYAIGRLLFAREWLAIAAALLLALTPVHFMYARMATDFQLWVPFALGWLLCVLLYIRCQRAFLLFAAGTVLGVGVLGYVAAYLLVPISMVLTVVALRLRRDPWSHVGVCLAGIALPLIICLPWLLRSPLPFRGILAHYAVLGASAPGAPEAPGLVESAWQRLREVPSIYASFWDPRFLFVDGPLRFRSTQMVAVFLVPIAGLMVVGLARALWSRHSSEMLVLACFACAALPPSVAGEKQAVWRALQLAPFGVLLAVSGLQQLGGDDNSRITRTAAGATFAIVILIAWWHHPYLPQAQAVIRAASLPLAVAGLAVLLKDPPHRAGVLQTTLVSAIVLAAMHGAYLFADDVLTVAVFLLTLLCLAALLAHAPDWLARRPLAGAALLALGIGHFLYVYVDYPAMVRVGGIPASLVILLLRFAAAAATVALAITTAWLINDASIDSLEQTHLMIATAMGVVLLQVAYFSIDASTNYRVRIVHAAVLLVGAIALARLAGGGTSRRVGFGWIAVAAAGGLVAMRFTAFYTDYFTNVQARGSGAHDGNVQAPFELVIDRASAGPVPAIYLGRLGPYLGGDLYWRFFLLKHQREDLQTRTITALDFVPGRILELPGGSFVITSPTREDDAIIEVMLERGELRRRELLKAPDGSATFWVLETGAP